jgi:leucine-zipper-like transcriptional regulator 1
MEWKLVDNLGADVLKVKNHSVVFVDGKLLIYGGFDGNKHKNSLHVLDLSKMTLLQTKTEGPLPCGRNGHTATLYNSQVYIIGGWNSSNSATTREIFTLHLKEFRWQKIEPIGEPMVACNMHSANLYGDRIYVFRGGDGTNYLNDLHCYDLSTNRWQSVLSVGRPPSPRANHSSAVFRDHLFIFGGWNGVDRLNDLFAFDFSSLVWRLVEIQSPLPRARAGMTLNAVRKGLLLFGGSGTLSASYNDLFLFDVDSSCWTECRPEGSLPVPRAGHTLTETSNRELVLLGGSSGAAYSTEIYVLDTQCPPDVTPIELPQHVDFGAFCNNPQFSDVQFLIEDQIVYAHKIIITKLSSHFRAMFFSGMRECHESTIVLKDVRFSTFLILLRYLYTGEVVVGAGTEGQEMSISTVLDILQTADRFFLDPIAQTCERILAEKVSLENVEFIQSAIEHTNSKYLKEFCAWFVDCRGN